jgi:hypothetical protein
LRILQIRNLLDSQIHVIEQAEKRSAAALGAWPRFPR